MNKIKDYLFKRLMWAVGYRRVLYIPSVYGLFIKYFWLWEYLPDTDKKDYVTSDDLFKLDSELRSNDVREITDIEKSLIKAR